MDREVHERNRAARERIRAAGARLDDDELARPLGPDWTAAALLAHVAFWDRFVHARWLDARETGAGTPAPIEDAPLEMINRAAMRQWSMIGPRAAVEEALAAAEEIDRYIASLEAEVVAELGGGDRRRLVDRSLHRGEHLDTIEQAFPDR